MMKRIGTKLTLQVMLVIGVIVAGFNWVELSDSQKALSANLDSKADRIMGLLEISLREPLWNLDARQIELILLAHLEDPDILSIRISEGESVLSYWGKGDDRSTFIDLKAEPSRVISFEHAFSRQTMIVQSTDIGSCEVLFSRQSVKEQMQEVFRNSTLFFVLLGAVLTVSIFSIMSRSVSGPVSRLSKVFQAVAEGDFEQDIETSRFDEIGSLARSFALLRDEIRGKILSLNSEIEERRRVENALRESERNYRMLIESLPQKIFYKDTHSVYVTCNERFANAFSLTVEDVRGKNDFDLFPEELAEKYRADDRRIIESKGTEEIVERYVEGGGEFIVQTVKTCTQNSEGDASGVLGIFWDITEQKQAQEEMSRLRSLLDNIVNSMPSMLVGVTLDGIVNQWNRRAEKITGKCAEDALGRHLSDVLPEFADETASVWEAIQSRKAQKYEKAPKEYAGEQHFFDVIIYPLSGNKDVEGAVIRIDDVTERVRIEELMIHAEKMMTVGGLAAGMAHEINNPLGVILQGAESTIRRISLELSGNQQAAKACGIDLEALHCYFEQRHIFRYLHGMRAAGLRAAQIVENMLSFSRKSESKFALCDVRELLNQTLELAANDYDLKKKYDFRKIEIVRDYEEDLPEVIGEASALQQVFFNLVKNAAQAMLESERRVQRLCVRAAREGREVRIRIEDTGEGMDETTRKRAFEPFFTTKSPGVGTGLGLSVSYFIISEHHKGSMSIDSTPGVGTTFTIRLPVRPPAP